MAPKTEQEAQAGDRAARVGETPAERLPVADPPVLEAGADARPASEQPGNEKPANEKLADEKLPDEKLAGEKLGQLRMILFSLATDLIGPAGQGGKPSAALVADEAHSDIDRATIAARQLESRLVQTILAMDRKTQQILALLAPQAEPGLRRRFFQWFGGTPAPAALDPRRDQRAAEALKPLLVEAEGLLCALQEHRTFLRSLLGQFEASLDEAITRLQALSATPEGEGLIDALQRRIDLIQELTDRIIAMLASSNLLINKLTIDAEERIIALTGLRAEGLDSLAARLPGLADLFQRAERGLLSRHGLLARQERLNEAFRSRLSASRHVAGG